MRTSANLMHKLKENLNANYSINCNTIVLGDKNL